MSRVRRAAIGIGVALMVGGLGMTRDAIEERQAIHQSQQGQSAEWSRRWALTAWSKPSEHRRYPLKHLYAAGWCVLAGGAGIAGAGLVRKSGEARDSE